MRDPETHQMVVEEITRFAMNNGYDVKNLDFHQSLVAKETLNFWHT